MAKSKGKDVFCAVRGDSLAEQVHAQLARMILSGAFAPNDRINLRQIAPDFSVSVTPVREAVLRLVSDGILQTTDRNAIVVPQRGADEIREIFEIRRVLEGDLAEAAATKLPPADIEALRETQADFIMALEKKDYREALRLNTELHFRIYTAAEMPVRVKIVEGLWLRIGPTLRNMYPILTLHRPDSSPHDRILSAASARDARGLREAVVADLNRSEEALLEYLRRAEEAQPFVSPTQGDGR
ncbi:GntR family transcriptional regulator [Paracoccus sp. TOH]|uniref:GntR family transcriptional regulator n=1 Tax=Paracoccus sp. TOH TaxID=1263728 RepID=UPI000217547E|nr:GntR family transcriptional regulator [Paracoccus sp. TOH]WJS85364.1 GntR family transcriptional regulator [Paracoccus sp. TOH]